VDIDDVRAVYDRVAERYADVFADELSRKPFDRRLLDDFADRCRGTGTVVDLGCGPGHVGAYLAQRGVEVAGIDLAPEMVAVANRRYPTLRFEIGDATDLAIPNATLAGVVAFYSLIHLPGASIRAALGEVRRVLRPHGRLLLALHAGRGEVRTDEFLGEASSVEAILYRGDEISERLDDAGFVVDIVRLRPPYPFEHPTDRLYVCARATRTPTGQRGGVGEPR
jgi:SAM-dependent methyltransferase